MTLTLDDLRQFCSLDDLRSSITKPFRDGDYTIATDGHILVRVPGALTDVDQWAPKTADLFARATRGEMAALPELPAKVPCDKCDHGFMECAACWGRGEHYCSSCGNEHPCAVCEGVGNVECEECAGTQIAEPAPMKLGTRSFAVRLLRRLSLLSDVMITAEGSATSAAYFTFDGGDGLLMPMRPE